jgi:DNA (cytosine-5)-methyltransferase 1
VNHLDLFSGIGGFTLAARWAGIRTVGFSEIDPFASAVLKKHWPKIKNYGDIRTITKTTIPGEINLITGGFPCQPFSTAGKQRGRDDPRDLWPEMFRVIKEYRPAWVVGENVAGFVTMELDRTLADLEAEGYTARAFIIPACAVNAPHRRDRVWIVAHTESQQPVLVGTVTDAGTRCTAVADPELPGRHGTQDAARTLERTPRDETWTQAIEQFARRARESVASNAESEQVHAVPESGVLAQHSDGHFASPDAHGGRSQEQQLPPAGDQQCDQSFADAQGAGLPCGDNGSWEEQLWRGYPFEHWRYANWFEAATGLCGMGNGLPQRTHRIKALGNAIVPQVAYEILKIINPPETKQ